MGDLLHIIFLLSLIEQGCYIRTINTLMAHGFDPREIVQCITRAGGEYDAGS